MDFKSTIRSGLEELNARGTLRTPRGILGPQGPELIVDSQRVIGLCSNNYLGLANDPRLVEATETALRSHGIGAAASRHICGSSDAHRYAEQLLAEFVGQPSAILFSSGYAANLGALQALLGPEDAVFSDALNHASLIDGCRLSRARIFVYEHLDLDHLQKLLRAHRARYRGCAVVSESVFSMDGDIADLPNLRALSSQHDCGLLVDEAHALGVFGPAGRGLCARDQLKPDLLVGTLGKAFGCTGAFVAGDSETIRLVENKARSYVFSTAPPAAIAAAAATAVDLVRTSDARRQQLSSHAEALRQALRRLDFRVPNGTSQIIPVHIGDAQTTMRVSQALLDRRVFVHGIRPPTVAEGTSRLRVTPMATHTEAQIQEALAAFTAVRNLI